MARCGINPEPQIQKMESMDEWRTLVKEKYDNLEKVVKDNLPSLWLAIEFVLSIRSIMNIAGVTLPWFGIILGRASSLKTAAIEMLRDTINTFYTDIFTPKAFVSNSTAVSKDKLEDIDMLPKSRINCSLFRNYLQCSQRRKRKFRKHWVYSQDLQTVTDYRLTPAHMDLEVIAMFTLT